jgi:putative transposase
LRFNEAAWPLFSLAKARDGGNLRLMHRLDELYMKRPFFGSRKMAVELAINRKRAQRLMRILGIEAHYPKPKLSRPAPGHEVYPVGPKYSTDLRK